LALTKQGGVFVSKTVLVPMWIKDDAPSYLHKMPIRPVLIEVETLGASLHGQMNRLMPTRARMMPNEPLLLRGKVPVRIRFRFADVEYNLGGLTLANDIDNAILVEFDSVTRKQIALFSGYLKDSGLLQAGEAAAMAAEEESKPHEPAAKPKRSKAEQRRVRREPPPGGVERRIHYRHELEAVVTLLVVSKGAMIKCDLLEISRGGCRVYTEIAPHIPQDCIVEVDFIGHGVPLRIAAKVKVKGDEHLLGLEFQKMSARTTERLQELLDELREKAKES